MHIFLTGEIQVGKSTLVNRVLRQLPEVGLAGFRTVTVADIPGAIGSVYLVDAADNAPVYSEENRIGIRMGSGRGIEAFPEVFESCGMALLSGAARGQLILMDEVGKTEAAAPAFCAAVSVLLDGRTPILGVVRKHGDAPLLHCIRSHPNVELMEVTPENRETLVQLVADRLRAVLETSASR